MKTNKALNKSEIQKYNKEILDWELAKNFNKISKEFKFKDFKQAISFVKKVAQIAEREDHHPDIHILYNKVLIELSTHSVGGLSPKDFIVASQIDAI